MAEVRVLAKAARDFARLDEFLRERSPEAADDLLRRFERALHLLSRTPRMGRPITQPPDHREVYVTRGGATWVIRYRLREEATAGTGRKVMVVFVVRAWHARELRS